MNFSFNGVRKSYTTVIRKKAPYWAPKRRIVIKVASRPGGILVKTEVDVRVLPVRILLEASSQNDLSLVSENFAEFLDHDTPVPLVFDDETERTYFAVVDGALDPDELVTVGFVDVTFLCLDPYKYGDTDILPFTDGQVTVYNRGTEVLSPTIRATVLADITYMDIFNDDAYMRIGWPVESGEVEFNPKTKLLNETFETITGWAAGGTVVDGGTVSGLMESNGSQFLVNDFGTPVGTTWHGPAPKKDVPGGPVNDFELEWNITFTNPTSSTRGRMELYLLDDQSNAIGKVAMKRVGGGAGGNTVEIRIGTSTAFHFYVSHAGDKGTEWKQFKGILRLSRKDNVWQGYVAMVNQETGAHHTRYRPKPFIDTERIYMQALAQTQVHIGKDTSPTSFMRSNHLDVHRLNTEPAKVPIIAVVGDLIEIDFKQSLISINGEPRPDLPDFGATYFKIPKGKTHLLIEPFEKLSAEIDVREVFL